MVFHGLVSSFRVRTFEEIFEEIPDVIGNQPDLDISDWEIKSGTKMVLPPSGNLYWWMAVKNPK